MTWHKHLRAQGIICDGPPGWQFLLLHCVIVGTPCFLEGERLRSDPPPMLVVCTPNHALFSHVMSKACVGILRWVLRAVVGSDRPQSQKGTDNDDAAPLPPSTPQPQRKRNQCTFYLLVIAWLLRIRQVILLQDPPLNKGFARIPPPNKGSARITPPKK